MSVSTCYPTDVVLEITLSYFREGRYADARGVLNEVLAAPTTRDTLEEIQLKLRLALVEQWDGNHGLALRVLAEIGPLVEVIEDYTTTGKYHVTRAYSLRRTDRHDDAIEALTAASVYYELAREARLRSDVENNLGNLLVDMGRVSDAHEHFIQALKGCSDPVVAARINESAASAYLKDGRPMDALPFALRAVQLVQHTEQTPILKENLRTLSLVCAALDKQFKLEDERARIREAFAAHPGKITAAARELKMHHQTLRWKLDNQYPDLDIGVPSRKKPRGPYAVRAKRA